jgi:hypothetical protein
VHECTVGAPQLPGVPLDTPPPHIPSDPIDDPALPPGARGPLFIFRKIHLYGKTKKSTHCHTNEKPICTEKSFASSEIFHSPATHPRTAPQRPAQTCTTAATARSSENTVHHAAPPHRTARLRKPRQQPPATLNTLPARLCGRPTLYLSRRGRPTLHLHHIKARLAGKTTCHCMVFLGFCPAGSSFGGKPGLPYTPPLQRSAYPTLFLCNSLPTLYTCLSQGSAASFAGLID